MAWWTLLPWLAAAYAATGCYTVGPDEQAIVRRCGRALEDLRGPGLHFGFPWGIDRVEKLKPQQYKLATVGTSLSQRAVGRQAEPQGVECLTGDRNLILVPAVVQYQITRPKDYLFNVADVPTLIRNVTAGTLCEVIASMKVDDVLTVKRITIQNEVRLAAQEILDRHRAGVRITSVSLEGMGPPEEQGVGDAFRDVTAARENAQQTINEAKGYRNQLIPRARGEADRIRSEAEAYGQQVVEIAQGDADHFRSFSAQLTNNRQLTFKRLILETMEEVLPRLRRKVILGHGVGEAVDMGLIEVDP